MEVLEPGEIVQCAECGDDLYEITEPIAWGETFDAEKFRPLGSVPKPKPKTEMRCPLCGDDLGFCRFRNGHRRIHLKGKGWV